MTLKRKFFSSIMTVAIALAASACGDSDGGGGKTPAPLECDDPGTGEQVWKLTSLTLPTGEENPPIGFDLDDHNTTSESDPVGCGIPDLAGGVDNQLGGLLGIAGEFLGDTDIDAIIAEALDGGDIDISIVLTGYDGPGDDRALLSLLVNGEEIEGVQDVCVGVDGSGNVVADLAALPIAIPEVEVSEGVPLELTLDLSAVKLHIDNPSAGGTVDAVLGGGALWDDGAGNGLGPALQVIIDDLVGGIPVNDIAIMFLDMGPDDACDSISLGVTTQFTLQD